jgi:hypothetical protein
VSNSVGFDILRGPQSLISRVIRDDHAQGLPGQSVPIDASCEDFARNCGSPKKGGLFGLRVVQIFSQSLLSLYIM